MPLSWIPYRNNKAIKNVKVFEHLFIDTLPDLAVSVPTYDLVVRDKISGVIKRISSAIAPETDPVATGKSITINQGAGIVVAGAPSQTLGNNPVWSITHSDTSSVANTTTTGAQVVSSLTFDTFGHVQTVGVRSITRNDLGIIDRHVSAAVITGTLTKVLSLSFNDGSSPVTASFSDIDDYTSSGTFNTASGALTFTRILGGTYSLNLDGRYYLASNPNGYISSFTDNYVNSVTFNNATRTLTLIRTGGLSSLATIVPDKYVASLAFSGTATKTLTLTFNDSSTISGNFTDISGTSGGPDDYTTTAAFTATTGNVLFTRALGGTYSVNLDGRYYLASNPNNYISSFTDKFVTGLAFTGTTTKTLTLTFNDATTVSGTFADLVGGAGGSADDYTTTAAFNSSTGNILFTRTLGGTYSVNLDGRYLTSYTDNYVNSAIFDNPSRVLTLGRTGALASLTVTIPDANKYVTALAFTGTSTKTLTLTFNDSTTISGDFADLVGGAGGGADDYTTSAVFNSGTGNVLFTRALGGTYSVNLDGRYITSSITADNGLTKTLSNVQLGGVLLHNTALTAAFNLSVDDGTVSIGSPNDAGSAARLYVVRPLNSFGMAIYGEKSTDPANNDLGIGVRGNRNIKNTTFSSASVQAGVYGEFGTFNTAGFTFSGGQFVNLSGLVGVFTMYNNTGNLVAGNSIFSGGAYYCNFAGTGNVDKATAIRVQYPQNTPTFNVYSGIVTNLYGLYIDDFGLSTLAAQITNRWAIYQSGAGETNFYKGNIVFDKLKGATILMLTVDTAGNVGTQAIPTGSGGAHVHGIANATGTEQFTFGVGDDVRFEGTGNTSISFDAATKKVIISSTAGAGADGNNYPTGVTFSSGTLAIQRNALPDISVSLDGRYITSVTSTMVTSALGYTPYNGATNPNGYISSFTDTNNYPTAVSVGGTGVITISRNGLADISSGAAAGTWGISITGNSVTTSQRTFDRVSTSNITQGSYGSISISGANNSWAGINFPDYSTTMMISATEWGKYNNNNAWEVYWLGGTLSIGTVPWANVSNKPTIPTDNSQIGNGAGYITTNGRAYPRRSDGSNIDIIWSAQGGQPSGLLGSNDGVSFYSWNPSNFSVNYATSAGSAATASVATNMAYTGLTGISGTPSSTTYLRGDGQWASVSSAGLTGSGTTNFVSKWSGGALTDSGISDDGANTVFRGSNSHSFYIGGTQKFIVSTTGLFIQNSATLDGVSVDGGSFPAFKLYNSGVIKGYFAVATSVGGLIDQSATNDTLIRAESRLMMGVSNNYELLLTTGGVTARQAITASTFYKSSDRRIKTSLLANPVFDGIENVQAQLYIKNGKTELGYFAQDVQKLLSCAVVANEEGFLELDYTQVLVAKVARLEKEVEELKLKIK